MTSPGKASAFVIAITPFTEAGKLDEPAARAHFGRLAQAGIGVYVGGGGSGEGYTLSPDETRQLLEIAVDELKGTVPVRAMGVEPRTAQQMIDFVATAAGYGVDATQIYSLEVGHAHLPTGAEVERYLTDVLDETTIPCVLSTHQSVGYQVEVDLIERLVADHGQIIGINCSHQDLRYLRSIVDAVGDRVEIHVGGEFQAVTALGMGATGFLSSAGNLAPRLAMSVIDAFNAGDMSALLEAHDRLVHLAGELYASGGIVAQKEVLRRRGLPGGYPRLPHLPASDAVAARIEATLRRLAVDVTEGWDGPPGADPSASTGGDMRWTGS
jgi:4-hydroxy-tetrahydrodipicolinate synthase